jgi:lycopene cyclase domain-containing protein
MCIFISWDVIFTNNGVWGFNDSYFIGVKLFNLPIEEWLFFICIPYACVFTHYALIHYFPNTTMSLRNVKYISYLLLITLAITALFNYTRWYTLVNFTYAIILVIMVLKTNTRLLQTYFLTFLVMLIPFLIVNGILTGSMIENEVVWYNNQENLGIRFFTIPIEDTIYAFTLILTNLALTEFFQSKSLSK